MSCRRDRVFAIGLLGTTNFDHDGDFQMVTDFVFLRELIAAPEHKSLWLSGAPLPDEDYILGDPASDVIAFRPPPFVTCKDAPGILHTKFISEVAIKANQMSTEDVLVLVLCGHGTHDALLLGGDRRYDLFKSQLEICVRPIKGTIWLINTACHSGSWASPYWSLLTATEANRLPVSGSDRIQNSFFTAAFIADYAKGFSPNPLHPGSVNVQGLRGQQCSHDSSALVKKEPVTSSPTQIMLRFTRQWIQMCKSRIGRVYTNTNLRFIPCLGPQREKSHKMPFRLLDSQLHHFRYVPPSPLNIYPQPTAANLPASSTQVSLEEEPALSADEVTLILLATKYWQSEPVTSTWNIPIIMACRKVVYRNVPLTNTAKLRLLTKLKDIQHRHRLAIAIAFELGWTTGAAPAARHRNKGYICKHGAEAAGCDMTAVYGHGNFAEKYIGAACWLASAWDAEGRPNIDSCVWQSAVAQAATYVQNNSEIDPDCFPAAD